jgi:hypothetical protein
VRGGLRWWLYFVALGVQNYELRTRDALKGLGSERVEDASGAGMNLGELHFTASFTAKAKVKY